MVKLIHCADLHLDSNMNSYLNDVKAKERKSELLETYTRMISYAVDNEVTGIIIAGDLFDKKNITATARNTVMKSIINNPQLEFYYLRGNHDIEGFWGDISELPDNLHIFNKEWTSYTLSLKNNNRLVITGMELEEENCSDIYGKLTLNSADINIVVLHGQDIETTAQKNKWVVNLRELKNHFIDYLALGHIHTFKEETLDARGIYCYPGCLTGRGFDECGNHGFVLLTIDDGINGISREFVPFSSRNLYELEVDISGCDDTTEISDRIEAGIENCCYSRESLVKIILTGNVNLECDINIPYLEKKFEASFYYVRIKDVSGVDIDFDSFVYDESLKGEFARLIKEDTSLSDGDKAKIIRYGILALRGEDI